MENSFLKTTYLILFEILKGWMYPVQKVLLFFRTFSRSLKQFQLIYLFTCLALMVFASPHWIVYEIAFQESKIITLGSESRIYFFITGMLGIILNLFKFQYNKEIFFAIVAITSLVYLFGFLFPQTIHTRILNPDDYSWNFIWIYLYGLSLIVVSIASMQAFKVNLLTPKQIKKFMKATSKNIIK